MAEKAGYRLGSPEVFIPMPIDREKLGKVKMEKLQKEIESLEKEQFQRKQLISRLAQMQEADEAEQQRNQKVLDRNRYSQDNFLVHEMERVYGRDTVSKLGRAPVNANDVIDSLISQRTKEFSAKQHKKTLETKYLVRERERLQEARERVLEQRRALLTQSPAGSVVSEPDLLFTNGHLTPRQGSVTPGQRQVHSVDSLVQNTVEQLPQTIDKIMRLRQDVQKHYERYKRPYRGEMGMQTYQHWQLPHYFMARGIVEDVVNEFLDLYFKPAIPMVEKEAYHALVHRDEREYERASKALSERKAIQLVMEEILLDVTGDMVTEIVDEEKHTYGSIRNMSYHVMMNRAEAIATGNDEGRQHTDPAYNIITRSFFGYQQSRNRTRKYIYAHSQSMTVKEKKKEFKEKKLKPVKKVQEEEEEEDLSEEQEDPDIVVLEYHHITPVDIKIYEPLRTDTEEVKLNKRIYQTYMKKELEYWANISTEVSEMSLSTKCGGVMTLTSSYNNRFIAVGTVHGDCLIYDTWTIPWRPIKVLSNNEKGDDPIIHISWSLDSQRITTVNSSGTVNLWTLLGGGVAKADIKKLGLPADADGILPNQLGLLFSMDNDDQDFMFQQGPHVEQEILSESFPPTVAAFYPSFTFFGIQNIICIGLETGDILKCDMEYVIPVDEEIEFEAAPKILNETSLAESAETNLIGKSVEAELLRRHKTTVIFIGFVDNINKVVTVDQDGYIMLWKCDEKNLAAMGWYTPEDKFRISRSKAMYTPSGADDTKIIFTDTVAAMPGEPARTRQEIADQRNKVQTSIENMLLGDPWHKEIIRDEGVISYVYAPKGGVKTTGAVFHIVMKHIDTGQLSSYITRMYKPVKVQYTKILTVKQSSSGKDLVFVMLFPPYPPKDAHITVVVFDMIAQEMKPFRRDFFLTEAEHDALEDNDMLFYDVSQMYGPTGAEYLFINIFGSLRVISLTTGKQVVMMQQKDDRFSRFAGCVIDGSELQIYKHHEVSVVNSKGKMYAVMYGKRLNKIRIFKFIDSNTEEQRRQMWKSFELWEDHRLLAIELRCDPVDWELPDSQHPAVVMRSIIIEAMDRAIVKSTKAKYTKKEYNNIVLGDKVNNYLTLEEHINQAHLLVDTEEVEEEPEEEEEVGDTKILIPPTV